jgi:hypothetical protein
VVPTFAYRPFDGTDAAVADVAEVEIECDPRRADQADFRRHPQFRIAERWELVLQSTPQALPEGVGPISVSNAAFLGYVVQPGVAQDKSGPSVACPLSE